MSRWTQAQADLALSSRSFPASAAAKIPPKIPVFFRRGQEKRAKRIKGGRSRRILLVELVSSVVDQELGSLLWRERHGVAELFESVDMMPLHARAIPLVKVIGS
jgi:hypothetical protein